MSETICFHVPQTIPKVSQTTSQVNNDVMYIL